MIRIFVGTPANNEDLECQAVLDWSIRKHASEPVDIVWMMLSRDPQSFWYSDPQARRGWQPQTWATPFSALRWAIPEFCNWQGRAIYMDSDQIAMADIAELWQQPIPKSVLMSKDGASCVMLFDNAKCQGVLPSRGKHWSDPNLFRHVRGMAVQASTPFQGDWNCRDGHGHQTIHDGDVKVLHYTSIPTQPNHKHARARLKIEGKPHWFPGPDQAHPRREITDLFERMFAECIAEGYGPETYRVAQEFGDYGRPKAAA